MSESIKNWAYQDNPKNKMFAKGASDLTNSELLAILLNTGYKENSALEISKQILQRVGNNLNELGKLSLHDFQQVKGVGATKAAVIAASIELGRRRATENILERVVLNSCSDIASYLQVLLKDKSYEVFGVIFLNQGNRVKHFEIVSQGGITGTVADPKIILRKALEHGATNLILTHNHPSGHLKPSRQDEALTQMIKQAARFFDINVLDHIIVSEEGYYSFADNGLM